jgi:glucose/arabinose dehydrogenase
MRKPKGVVDNSPTASRRPSSSGYVTGAAAAVCVIVGVLALGTPSAFAKPPKGFVTRTLVRGLTDPTAFAFAPDGRIFIGEKAGVVRVFDHGRLEEFADLRGEINNYDDRGLLGLALDPKFAENGWVYVGFTKDLRPGDPDKLHPAGGAVIRLRASRAHPDVGDLSSRQTILDDLPTPGAWHSVGGLAFDRQGRLIVGMGDGSPYFPQDIGPTKRGETALVALDLDSPNGKILRVDRDTGRGVPDNPFYVAAHPGAVRSKILAYGLRNPFRFSVDQRTGDIWIGDPGSSFWEELDEVPAHWSDPKRELDFGWPCYEGGSGHLIPQPAMVSVPECKRRFYSSSDPPAAAPMNAYHLKGSAIIGGPVYDGSTYPKSYRGKVFFADVIHDVFFTFEHGHASMFGSPGGADTPVDIAMTPGGNIAYAAFGAGQVRVILNVSAPASAGGSANWIAILVGLGVAAALALLLAFSPRARQFALPSRRR